VLAAEHEQRKIEAGDHIRRELREIGIFERRAGVLVTAAPQKPRREVTPERRVAEKVTSASVESGLVRGRGRRAETLQNT
jgi:hypothetical protein